jgi:hypothetical protein
MSRPLRRADGHYDRNRLEFAIRHGFCIVRWSPRDAAAREAIHGLSGV